MPTKNSQQAPSLIKLGACLLYECLVMIAIAFVGAGLFVLLFGEVTYGMKKMVFQCVIWLLIGIYFVMSWTKKGQTLPMRSWKLKLISCAPQTECANSISLSTAVLRYVLATLSLSLFGLGFLWRLFDKDQLFLHDRLLNTKIILL